MNNTYYGKLIFECSNPGAIGYSFPLSTISSEYPISSIPSHLLRDTPLSLPECDELTVVRHYTNSSNNNFGVDTGFYPLGSCTMKYNPKINDEIALHPKILNTHPLQPDNTVQGLLYIYDELQKMLSEITGLEKFTLNPYAGAQGELTGLMIIRSYHETKGDYKRKKIIVPDSAHGTNPASAAVCGLEVVEVKSNENGTIDIDSLKTLLNDEIAGMMMTNPNTLGIFETQIPEISKMIHACGGLLYYDGANFNPIIGICRPGDMGFDVLHINLHKTFSTPHGGGGPGAGPVGVRKGLEQFLPNPEVVKDNNEYTIKKNEASCGNVTSYLGNFGILVRAYCYLLSIGKENLSMIGKLSVLNANYVKESLKDFYKLPIKGLCKHEFVFNGLKDKYAGEPHEKESITTLDIAKRLLDYGFHAPTIYFPLLFHEAMMIEPTETESKNTLDAFINVMKTIAQEAYANKQLLKTAPHHTPIRRLDDVKAVKSGQFTFKLIKDE